MNELRELRRAIRLGQRGFAALLSIPLETYRPWDSGRRVVSAAVLQRAREAVVHYQRLQEAVAPHHGDMSACKGGLRYRSLTVQCFVGGAAKSTATRTPRS